LLCEVAATTIPLRDAVQDACARSRTDERNPAGSSFDTGRTGRVAIGKTDRAVFEDPNQFPGGIEYVIVNGL
jgi:hypothetical protein